MKRVYQLLGLIGCSVLIVVSSACSSKSDATAPRPSSPAGATRPELWGEMKPVVSVKELMRDMIDPASDFVFDSVGTIISKGKRVERIPRTDADWDRVRMGAVTLAEGVYLLKIPRPFAPAGDENNSEGAEAFELSPEQIKAKLDKDPVLWNAKIEALRNVGLEVMEIVKRRDVNELWDAAENLDQACENCHLEYWYPGEKELLPQLDRKLEALYGPRTGNTAKFGMTPGKR